MEYKGSTVYDNEEFFDHYMQRRHRTESPNSIIETPALMALLGESSGKTILDIGCGDGTIGLELLNHGAESYTGVDGSFNMVEKAKQALAGRNASFIHATMEDYTYPLEAFQRVISQLAIHYIEDIDTLFSKVFRTLKTGGRFVFSVQHPLLTSSFVSATASGKRYNWIVDDYFKTGKRVEPWIGEHVIKYHHTIEDYFIGLQKAGFMVEGLREATPKRESFASEEEFQRRLRIPMFLLFSCRKTD